MEEVKYWVALNRVPQLGTVRFRRLEGYFGDLGMLAYVRDVQRREIRRDLAAVKHQDLAGSNVGDDHKEYFLGEKALLAGGTANTMNQF